MSTTRERMLQDTEAEEKFQARVAAELASVAATPAVVIKRYSQHLNWRHISREFVFRCVVKYASGRVCDFGCGAGETSTEMGLMGLQVVGFDLSPEMIALARHRAELDKVEDKVQFMTANALDIELQTKPFDLVVVQGVLHHLVDVQEGLTRLLSLMKPGGIAIIHEPIAFSKRLQRLREKTPVPKDISPNERQLEQRDIVQIEAAFEVVERRYFSMFGRLRRLIPERHEQFYLTAEVAFGMIDSVLFACLPRLTRYAGVVVMVCRKR